jgi:hypothetical protein
MVSVVPWKGNEGAEDAVGRMLRKHWVRVRFGRTGMLWLCKNCGHDFAGRQFSRAIWHIVGLPDAHEVQEARGRPLSESERKELSAVRQKAGRVCACAHAPRSQEINARMVREGIQEALRSVSLLCDACPVHDLVRPVVQQHSDTSNRGDLGPACDSCVEASTQCDGTRGASGAPWLDGLGASRNY